MVCLVSRWQRELEMGFTVRWWWDGELVWNCMVRLWVEEQRVRCGVVGMGCGFFVVCELEMDGHR